MTGDPYRYFRVEARELIDQLGVGILQLEQGTASSDVVPRLLRVAHTLKGAARVVRQGEIADHAHAIEGTLAPLRESATAISRERIDDLLTRLDAITGGVAALSEPASPESASRAAKPPSDEALRTVRTDVAEMDGLLHGVAETHAQIGTLRDSVRSVERARHLIDLLVEQMASDRRRDPVRGEGTARDASLSTANDVRSTLKGLERALTSSVDRIDRELGQVHGAAEQLRLVPAGALFTSLARAVRDAAHTVGKRVSFEGRGVDARLDAHVLEAVQGALLQLVRNAVAHGIESEADRVLLGKPAEGHVIVSAARQGRHVLFACTDDGRGVDLDAVRRAALRRGMSSSKIQTLDSGDVLRLLLEGGLTTSSSVTEVAGRGIGLDVVREVAERLGGSVTVDTTQGSGTTVRLLVPLSVASVEALVVEASGIRAGIPLDAVRHTLRVHSGELTRTPSGESLVIDGKTIPFVRLSQLIGSRDRWSTGHPDGVVAWSALVVEGSNGTAAVGVDRLLGSANVVLRTLPDLMPTIDVMAGASMDAEGNPQLVLDADGIVAAAKRVGFPQQHAETPAPLLVVDDSLTTRMLEKSILESAGYDVDVATSAEEGLERARHRRYGLFLVDIEMPGMDGLEFTERIRTDPNLRETPVMLVTSSISTDHRRRGSELAQGYIVKSEFDQAEFLNQIKQLMR